MHTGSTLRGSLPFVARSVRQGGIVGVDGDHAVVVGILPATAAPISAFSAEYRIGKLCGTTQSKMMLVWVAPGDNRRSWMLRAGVRP